MVQNILLWSDISKLQDPLIDSDKVEYIPTYRKERLFNFNTVMSRKQCLCAGLMESYIAREYGFSFDDFFVDEKGKPHIKSGLPVHYNISHSNNIVICAIGNEPVGCDVEQVRDFSVNIVKRVFSEKEQSNLNTCSSESFKDLFFRFWTIKESFVKMCGTGISHGLSEIEILFNTINNDNKILIKNKDIIEDCTVFEYEIPGYSDYKISLCSKELFLKEALREFAACNF